MAEKVSRAKGRKGEITIVNLATLIRWHRKGFRLFWRRKSRCAADDNCPCIFNG